MTDPQVVTQIGVALVIVGMAVRVAREMTRLGRDVPTKAELGLLEGRLFARFDAAEKSLEHVRARIEAIELVHARETRPEPQPEPRRLARVDTKP